MTTRDIIHETVSALTGNKVRTSLTMLGIVIGISSVITMVSIGRGAQSAIETNIQSIGSNLIIIMPGAQRSFGNPTAGRGSAKTLTFDDAESIKSEVTGIKNVAPEVTSRYQITAKGTNSNTSVVGTVASYTDVRNITVETGSFISSEDVQSRGKVAVIGPTTRDDLFGAEATDVIGSTIRIKGVNFRIIGITKSKGGSGFSNADDVIYVPITSAQLFLAGDTSSVSTISISASNADEMTQVQADITALLLSRHRISNPVNQDFNVMNQADIVSAASSVTSTFTILLGAVAGISLLVGGIGIMNMMLTTVTERTKEIGLRKAIGAKRRDISIQFLTEAIALTVIGGVIGIILGAVACYAISRLGILQTTLSLSSIVLAFAVSAFIGIVFGYYPARRASKLNPIEALRYE